MKYESKQLLKIISRILLVAGLILSAVPAYAVCPLCVFGAAAGAISAVRTADMYAVGVWWAGLSYMVVFLFMKAIEKYSNLSVKYKPVMSALAGFAVSIFALPVLFLSIKCFSQTACSYSSMFCGDVAVGLLAGLISAFVGVYTACVFKRQTGFSIPFMRVMLILSFLYLASIIPY